ncbi:SRPBCC domain-containing protein [Micromonospora sp. B9E7]|uniref:SRPBCC domain-containing protein n=1 Tax=Micromonospora sp. B9E7 TaxID=3153574 RepID=UPI00325F27C5
MGTVISTTIDIAASPQAVWKVLTEFAAYQDWNPFMRRIEGTAEVGTKLVVHLSPPGGRSMTFKPTVLTADPGQELRWLGKLGFGGLFDGEHSFVLTANADGSTHLTHSERFSGLLVVLFKGTLKNTHTGFDAFNQALKQRVETARRPQ